MRATPALPATSDLLLDVLVVLVVTVSTIADVIKDTSSGNCDNILNIAEAAAMSDVTVADLVVAVVGLSTCRSAAVTVDSHSGGRLTLVSTLRVE